MVARIKRLFAICGLHSKLVRSSNLTLLLGLSTASIPGPIGCACRLDSGKICEDRVRLVQPEASWQMRQTLVLLHPNLNAASCANSSPNPSIMPLTKGRKRLIAAPRRIDQKVGGWYRMTAGDDEDGGDVEMSSPPEYCSLSDGIVTPDSAIGFGASSEAMLRWMSAPRQTNAEWFFPDVRRC